MVFTQSQMLNLLFSCRNLRRSEEIADMILLRYYPQEAAACRLHARDMAETIRSSARAEDFLNSLNGLKTELMYQSFVHGQTHAERVAVYSAWLGLEMQLSRQEFLLCLEAAKYHDIGRENESEDREHGPRSAGMIGSACPELSEEERRLLQAVIAVHSLPDRERQQTFDCCLGARQSLYAPAGRLADILKDADALDRFRLNNNSLATAFLRCPPSRRLIRAACETVNL